MPVQITMPQLSDTMTEGTVVKWHKKEGDKVKQGEELVDVETDKATMPFEASESGTLAHVAVKEGEKVPVGALIAVLATAKENAADVKKQQGTGGGVATRESASRGGVHEPEGVGHGAPREAATAVPPLPGGQGGQSHGPDGN